MRDECLICGAPLEYLAADTSMICALCGKAEPSKTRCIRGHYVCSDCHTSGMDSIVSLCLQEKSANPVAILERMMSLPFCHMHGPEHHILVGASLLTAYKNAGGKLDLPKALGTMQERGKKVPGGVCGLWGSCGAAVSSGIFVSIVTGATPLSGAEWGLCNQMTSASLAAIGAVGGPRCCKRNGALAIETAVAFAREHLGIPMELGPILCTHYEENNQCLGSRCPYHP